MPDLFLFLIFSLSPYSRFFTKLIYFLPTDETCHGMSLQNSLLSTLPNFSFSHFPGFSSCRTIALSFFRAIVPPCPCALTPETQNITSLLPDMMPFAINPIWSGICHTSVATWLTLLQIQRNDNWINHRMTMTFYCTIWFFCLPTHYFPLFPSSQFPKINRYLPGKSAT